MSEVAVGGTPEVSVLVPVYNVERYLDECLSSLLSQDLGDFEVIVVNDGSTDGSREIIARHAAAAARVRVVDKPNSGYGASMNRGLDEARGTYVAILESDDVMAPGALRLLRDAARDGDAEVAKGDFWLWWSGAGGGQARLERFGAIPRGLAGRTVDPAGEGRDVFYVKPSIWSALYRRDFLERNDIRFLETPGASYQDAAFNFKVWAAARRAAFVDEPVLRYRQDNEASSVRSPGKAFCVMDEYAEMLRWLETRPGDHAWLLPVLGRMKLNTYLWNYDRLSPELRPAFLERASAELARDLDEGIMDGRVMGPVKFEELRCMALDPARFARARAQGEPAPGALPTARHVLALGGPAALARVLSSKLGRGR